MIKMTVFLSLLIVSLTSIAADNSTEAIQKRIEPVGHVNITPEVTAQTKNVAANTTKVGEQKPSTVMDGKATYEKYCIVCHGAGVAGAPKFGDKDAWKPRIAKGIEKLNESAMKGVNAMPPKGTCMDCTDDQLKAAVKYMTDNSK